MKEKFFKMISTWRFWLSFQFVLIVVLNIIGHIRAGHRLDEMLGLDAFIRFVGTIIGFPSGVWGFFQDKLTPNTLWFHGLFNAYVLPVIYYSTFFLLVKYIHRHKKHWKLFAIALIAFMLLSFGGCSRIIEFHSEIL